MPDNNANVEEAVLALLGIFEFEFEFEFENGRAWKRFGFDVMDALHEKGYITDSKGRHESVHLNGARYGVSEATCG